MKHKEFGIWHHQPNLVELNERGKNTLTEAMGIQFTEFGKDYLIAQMPVDTRTKQPLGILHGGASCALVETVASTAANIVIDMTTYVAVGLDLNANHLRKVTEGHITAIAKAVHLGQTTQVWTVDLFNDAKQQICIARMTMAVIPRTRVNT